MGRSVHNDILSYIKECPYWQKYLYAYLTGKLTVSSREEAIKTAVQYFLSKKDILSEPLEEIELTISAAINLDKKTNPEINKFVSISNLKNIAAIRENQKLPINESGITAIFGATGAGKSSYARVMNDAFISRGDINVIGNVFDPDRTGEPEATFTFKDNKGEEYELAYPDKKNSTEFKEYATFDSTAVEFHIDSDNEPHVTPKGFDLLRNFAILVSDTSQHIQTLIKGKTKENVFYRHFPENSEIKATIVNLDAGSNIDDIEKMASFNEKDAELIKQKDQELAKLKVDDPAEKIQLHRDITTEVEEIKKFMEKMSSVFSQENIEKVKKQIEQRIKLISEISHSGTKKFSNQRLKGVGSPDWKKFIDAGNIFSSLQEKPWNKDDPCPYCHQDLTLTALKLIQDYEIYLKSNAEMELKKSDEYILERTEVLQNLEILSSGSNSKAMHWLNQSNNRNIINIEIQKSLPYYSYLKNTLIKILTDKTWHNLEFKDFEFDWKTVDKNLKEEKETFNSEKIEKKKKELDTQITNLKHRKILKELIPEIKTFVNDMIWINKCQVAQSKIRTNAITNFSKQLHEEHVTNLYREQFEKECSKLNVKSPELKQVGQTGNTKRSYTVGNNTTPSNVLSEGEQRAVALADFFTEIKISKINGGLIFDDPAASQDCERKDLIARKLVQEALSRQVIVFTHDSAFLCDLTNACSEKNVNIIYHYMSKNDFTDAGIIHAECKPGFEKSYIKPEIAQDYLNEATIAEDPEYKRRCLMDGYSALRTSYEAFLIITVFKSAITRFNRIIKYHAIGEIHAPPETLNKISNKLNSLSRNISGHLRTDVDSYFITPFMLEEEITEYKKMCREYEQKGNKKQENSPHTPPEHTTKSTLEKSRPLAPSLQEANELS